MFARVVCGVDGSIESLEAVRQADVVLSPGGRLVLVAAVDLSDTIHFQIAPTAIPAAPISAANSGRSSSQTPTNSSPMRPTVTRFATRDPRFLPPESAY